MSVNFTNFCMILFLADFLHLAQCELQYCSTLSSTTTKEKATDFWTKITPGAV